MNRPPRSLIGPRAACAAASASIVPPTNRADCSWLPCSATHAPDRDRSSCGDVERIDTVAHRDAHLMIAAGECTVRQARAFGAEEQCHTGVGAEFQSID